MLLLLLFKDKRHETRDEKHHSFHSLTPYFNLNCNFSRAVEATGSCPLRAGENFAALAAFTAAPSSSANPLDVATSHRQQSPRQ